MKKASLAVKQKMLRSREVFRKMQNHFSEDENLIKEIPDSKLNQIQRIEQQNHIIPVHRTKLDKEFIPIVWQESLDYAYEMAKTLYQPSILDQ